MSNVLFITDGQNDRILDHINKKYVIFNEQEQDLPTYKDIFRFVALGDKRYAEHIGKRNKLLVPGEDGEYYEFRLFESHKYRDGQGLRIEGFARATYLDLKTARSIDPFTSTSETAEWHARQALAGMPFEVGRVAYKGTRSITFENHTNPYDYLLRIAREFDLELHFYVEHDEIGLTGRYVDLVEQVGESEPIRRVEFGRDLQGIRRIEKTDQIVTALRGLGPIREDGTRLEVFVEDREALERWGENGQHIIETYEPISDRLDMTEDELRQYTQTELNKRVNAIVNYEAGILDLENVAGMENKRLRFGGTVHIKDTEFNPPLYLEARVHNQKRDVFRRESKRVVLGDYIEYTEEEVNAIWNQLRQQIRDKISEAQLVDYTYSKEDIDQKDTASEQNAKEYADEQDNQIKQETSQQISQTKQELVEQITTEIGEVNSAITNLRDRTSNVEGNVANINQEINEIEGRLSTTITQLSNIDGVVSEHSLTLEALPGQLNAKAEKSEVYTRTEIDNQLSNKVDTTIYNNKMTELDLSIDGISGTVSNIEASIDDLSGELTSAVSQIANLDIKADGIITSVSEIRADLDGLEIGGRNLLTGTKDELTYVNVSGWADYQDNNTNHTDLVNILQPGETYTLRVFLDARNSDYPVGVRIRLPNETNPYRDFQGNWIEAGEQGYSTVTFVMPSDATSSRVFMIRFNQRDTPTQSIGYGKAKLEKGNKATDWTPAPEDVDARITSAEGSIETLAGEVRLKASQTSVDSIEERLSTAEGELRVLPGMIESKVTEGEVRSIFTQEASSFTFSANQINFDGHIFGQGATFNGRIATENELATIELNPDGSIHLYDYSQVQYDPALTSELRFSSGDGLTGRVTYYDYDIDSYVISMYTFSPREISIVNSTIVNEVGSFVVDIKGEKISFNGRNIIDTFGDSARWKQSNSNYIWQQPSGDVHFYANGHRHSLRADGTATHTGRLTTAGLTSTNTVIIESNTYSFLRPNNPNNELRVANSSGQWSTVRAYTANPSSEKWKTDIKDVDFSALDLLKQSKIYSFIRDGRTEREIGFIIERETPDILKDGEGVNGYSHSSLNTLAIQELDTKVSNISDDVEWLKIENQYLKQKVKQLEEMVA